MAVNFKGIEEIIILDEDGRREQKFVWASTSEYKEFGKKILEIKKAKV